MRKLLQVLFRGFKSDARRHVLRQDVDSIKEHKLKRPAKGFDTRLYVWGLAETGALGNEKSKDRHKMVHKFNVTYPTRQQFAEMHHVKDFACGYGFSAFVVQEENGTHSLYGTGINSDGQLGVQLSRQSKQLELLIYPVKIGLDHNIKIKSLDAGRAHLAVISNDNTIYTLGNNSYGQAARRVVEKENFAKTNQVNKCTIKDETSPLKSVTCGQDHTMILTESGKVYSCGWGSDGQTGLGKAQSNWKLTQVSGDIANEKIIKISAASDCVLALNDRGEVFGWGNSEYGQFNGLCDLDEDHQQILTPTFLFSTNKYGRIIDIAAGGSFCLILNDEGEVFVWGYGVLGFGPEITHLKMPRPIPSTLFGRNEFNPSSRVESITAGLFHMGAVTNDGDLYSWGVNRFGSLGLGDKTKNMYFPFKVVVNAKVKSLKFGADHTIALCKPFI